MHPVSRIRSPWARRGLAVGLLLIGAWCIGVALGLADGAPLMYARCRTCPRTETASLATLAMTGAMFLCAGFGSLAATFRRSGGAAQWLGALAWLTLCSVLARHAAWSDDPGALRAWTGVLAAVLFFGWLAVWLAAILLSRDRPVN